VARGLESELLVLDITDEVPNLVSKENSMCTFRRAVYDDHRRDRGSNLVTHLSSATDEPSSGEWTKSQLAAFLALRITTALTRNARSVTESIIDPHWGISRSCLRTIAFPSPINGQISRCLFNFVLLVAQRVTP